MTVPVVLVALLLTSKTFAFVYFPRNVWLHEMEMMAMSEMEQSQHHTSSCPFSKSFPRYRIDFTPVRRKENESSFSLPFLSGMASAMEKSKFRQQYKNAIWLEKKDGVEAFASLWRAVADLTTCESTKSILLSLPDCNKRLLQRFVDILDWLNQEPSVETPVRVDAIILDESTPAIQLTRIGKASRLVNENSVDPSIVTKRTQAWVKRILVNLSVCPFTKSVTKSGQGLGDLGVPVGRIAYDTCNALPNQMYNLMAETWESIHKMLQAGPFGKNGVSSILFAAPAFDDDFDLWSGPVFAMLEAGVVAAGAEKEVGVVCFHPRYATPDGKSWPGFGQMHSVPRLQKWLAESDSFHEDFLTEEDVAAGGAWQRRTPHATINVLRADQLEIAEKRRATGNLYTENILKLVGSNGIGSDQLAADLERERRLTL